MLGLIGQVPESWRELEFFLMPIAWIAGLQRLLIDFFLDSSSVWTALAKYVLLALPALLVLAGLWCTQLSLYTLPFRSRRIEFLSTLLMAWWAGLGAAWMYWVGVIRVVAVLGGWLLAFMSLVVKLVGEVARHLVLVPASATARLAGEFFRPGVPWLAVMMLVLWCALEAMVFTYLLLPTLGPAFVELFGVDQLPQQVARLLWFVLFLLIMSSFVCIQVLVNAIKRREFARIVLIGVVELFVMFLGVAFLYRELAEAITPWLVQQAEGHWRPGPWFTLSVARSGWLATRCLAWFLFGQYGTPALLAVISRQAIAAPELGTRVREPAWWPILLREFERHDWLQGKRDELVAYLGAPILRLLAATLNFPMVLVSAQPILSLPVPGLKEGGEPSCYQTIQGRDAVV